MALTRTDSLVAGIAVITAIYVAVRGLDNMKTGWGDLSAWADPSGAQEAKRVLLEQADGLTADLRRLEEALNELDVGKRVKTAPRDGGNA